MLTTCTPQVDVCITPHTEYNLSLKCLRLEIRILLSVFDSHTCVPSMGYIVSHTFVPPTGHIVTDNSHSGWIALTIKVNLRR